MREFISSGEADQEVSDDGTFRKLFLDVLAGKEPDADANHDGYVTGTELGLFLHQKMTNLTNNRQTPRYGKLTRWVMIAEISYFKSRTTVRIDGSSVDKRCGCDRQTPS